jgi:hypothetical protein
MNRCVVTQATTFPEEFSVVTGVDDECVIEKTALF